MKSKDVSNCNNEENFKRMGMFACLIEKKF